MGLRAAGNNFKTLEKYIELYDINISHFIKNYNNNKKKKIELEKILIINSSYNRKNLKKDCTMKA